MQLKPLVFPDQTTLQVRHSKPVSENGFVWVVFLSQGEVVAIAETYTDNVIWNYCDEGWFKQYLVFEACIYDYRATILSEYFDPERDWAGN